MKNIIYAGTKAGFIATLGATLLESLGALVLRNTTTVHMLAKLIFPIASPSFLQLSYGLIVHLTAGSLLGIVIAILFKLLDFELSHILALMAGLVFWIVHTMVVPNLVAQNISLYRTELEVLIDLLSHLVYGFLTIAILQRLLHESPNNP